MSSQDIFVVYFKLTQYHYVAGVPNDGFLPNALKRCYCLSGVLLKLCRLILGCAIKFLSVCREDKLR